VRVHKGPRSRLIAGEFCLLRKLFNASLYIFFSTIKRSRANICQPESGDFDGSASLRDASFVLPRVVIDFQPRTVFEEWPRRDARASVRRVLVQALAAADAHDAYKMAEPQIAVGSIWPSSQGRWKLTLAVQSQS